MREFSHNFTQPAQLSAELLDDEFDHPDGFMKSMAHFFFHRTQCFQFAVEFGFQKLLTTLELLEDGSRRGLPGKRHPCEKRRTIALVGPVLALKCGGQSCAPFCSGGKDAALGTQALVRDRRLL